MLEAAYNNLEKPVTTMREWEVTVSITRSMKYPIEDNEGEEEIIKWANSLIGKRHIQADFTRRLNCCGFPRNADMIIEEVELKETEVKSTDTDPRV